jgi:hypothetical protein
MEEYYFQRASASALALVHEERIAQILRDQKDIKHDELVKT